MRNFSLHDEEHIRRLFRQTKLVLAKPGLIALVSLYIPWSLVIRYEVTDNAGRILWLWSALVAGYFLRSVALWWRIKYIITNQRLTKIFHDGLFRKIVIETPLDRILNVSFKTTGFFSSLMRFGDVEVQVVGLMEPVILRNVRHPGQLKDYLWEAHERSLKRQNRFEADSIPHLQEQIGYTKKNQKIV